MAILKIVNLIAAGAYVLLAVATFWTAGASDAAGEGMAKGFAVILLGIAGIGLLLALISTWPTQIIASLILLVPLAFSAKQRLDSYGYARQLRAEADGSAYFSDDPGQQLAAAVTAGDLARLQEQLPGELERINDVSGRNWSLLEVAVNQFMSTRGAANLEVIEHLLDQGADPNIRSRGRKPLITETDVIVEGRIFAALMEHGADPNAVDLEGRPVLWNVVAHFGEEADKVKLLLDKGADPNPPAAPELPLAIAARRMHWANCLLLLEAGADPNLPEAAEFWQRYDDNARSYKKYNDAPPEFLELSRHPVIRAARP